MQSTVKWYGHTDAHTSPATYFYHGVSEMHQPQFEAVFTKLKELTFLADNNGDAVVQLIASRETDKVHFVAFRFTSDWAYRQWSRKVQELGMSLGRGSFDPWVADSNDYDTYLAE